MRLTWPAKWWETALFILERQDNSIFVVFLRVSTYTHLSSLYNTLLWKKATEAWSWQLTISPPLPPICKTKFWNSHKASHLARSLCCCSSYHSYSFCLHTLWAQYKRSRYFSLCRVGLYIEIFECSCVLSGSSLFRAGCLPPSLRTLSLFYSPVKG